jgi:hypothetical protein
MKRTNPSAVALRLVAPAAQPPVPEPSAVDGRVRRPTILRLVDDDLPRRQLLQTLTIVTEARRHALRRHRHKRFVGQVTLYSLLTMAAALAAAPALPPDLLIAAPASRLALLAVVCVLSSLVAALRLGGTAATIAIHELQSCIAALDAVRGDLDRASADGGDCIRDLRRAYHDVMRRCGAGHSYFDYVAARQSAAASPVQRWRDRLGYAVRIAVPDALPLAAPLLVVALGL